MTEKCQDQNGNDKLFRKSIRNPEYFKIIEQNCELVASDDQHVQRTTDEIDLSTISVRRFNL
jgi:hypothetical protein